jgi:hypothetical protein
MMKESLWQKWAAAAKDSSRWENHNERGLLKAEPMGDYVLRLWFEEELDVSIYELDFAPLFVEQNPGGVFTALLDPVRFQQVVGDYALIWPDPETGVYDENVIDLAPECVRFFCERYGRLLKGPGQAAHFQQATA